LENVVEINDIPRKNLVEITLDHDSVGCGGDTPYFLFGMVVWGQTCGTKCLIHQRMANAIPDLLAHVPDAEVVDLGARIRLGTENRGTEEQSQGGISQIHCSRNLEPHSIV
jgi:hypothetical protein